MTLLEIFIPTYNRPIEFTKCLNSLINAILCLTPAQKMSIGIAINDNSTTYLDEYYTVLNEYSPRFSSLGLSYYQYRRTGFNIGAINNIVGGILSSQSQYLWCLPDDDLARFDALQTLLPILQRYTPCFVSAAWSIKSGIEYSSDEVGFDDHVENSIFDVIVGESKVSSFLSKNVVQLQEYVYQVDPIRRFLRCQDNHSLLNDMLPGLIALVCLWEEGPFVRLNRSIGIFRDGDPRSNWRHLASRLFLIEWPILSEELFNRGLLSCSEYHLSVGVFRSGLLFISKRPDIILGLNPKFRINPFLLYKYHQEKFLFALLMMPNLFAKALYKKIINMLSFRFAQNIS